MVDHNLIRLNLANWYFDRDQYKIIHEQPSQNRQKLPKRPIDLDILQLYDTCFFVYHGYILPRDTTIVEYEPTRKQ